MLKNDRIHFHGADESEGVLGFGALLVQLLDQIPQWVDYECHSISNGVTDSYVSFDSLRSIQYQKDVVIWLTTDHLRGANEFDWYGIDKKPYGLTSFEDICSQYPSKKFILLTSHAYMQRLVEVDNLFVVTIPPYNWLVDKKNFHYEHGYKHKTKIEKSWATFINYPIWHRVSLAAYLSFLELDATGYMSVSDLLLDNQKKFKRIENFLSYQMSPFQWHCLEQGYKRLGSLEFNRYKLPPYYQTVNAKNFTNYHNNLLPVYKKIGVEVISSSIFSEPSPYLTEKELQGIYGCNFLIIIGPAYTVKQLREIGFDMFDDIVNHSYDEIVDPVNRLISAINDNIHLLNGTTDLDSLFKGNVSRFESNCLLADVVIDHLVDQSVHNFKDAINKILYA